MGGGTGRLTRCRVETPERPISRELHPTDITRPAVCEGRGGGRAGEDVGGAVRSVLDQLAQRLGWMGAFLSDLPPPVLPLCALAGVCVIRMRRQHAHSSKSCSHWQSVRAVALQICKLQPPRGHDSDPVTVRRVQYEPHVCDDVFEVPGK